MKIEIRLTKKSPTHHTFVCIREDGMRETAELETKSFLMHDLLHFSYETEARLQHSFYGLLASGHTYAELSGKTTMSREYGMELLNTERVVGPLTSVAKGQATPRECLASLHNLYAGYGEHMPQWISEKFIASVKTRMRRLMGRWDGTPFGKTMVLRYEL